ncbi:uncharacterized protein PAC_01347 [Phialocephala subalpina]|uniref:Alpha/beta hydrolase fold-3 domain-containing protein n=1 Tax=Phialocephala subalpina TaxID=576137 RepID=A0A1L7WFC7_9HELO|nr:uncharacterized protein PAC_01347 [Phialocephala subalpina]
MSHRARDIQTSSNFLTDASQGLQHQVTVHVHQISVSEGNTIPIAIYIAAGLWSFENPTYPIYAYFHGGGFMFGSLESEHAACMRLAAKLHVIVISICYRHTPQHPWPAAWTDATIAMDWIYANALRFGGDPTGIVVGGVGFGAHLAMHVVRRWKRKFETHAPHIGPHLRCTCAAANAFIRGVLLCTPWFYLDFTAFPHRDFASFQTTSRWQYSDAPILNSAMLAFFVQNLRNPLDEEGPADIELEDDVYYSNWPQITIMVAGSDPLRDDGLLLAQKLRLAGIPHMVHPFWGLPHDFRQFDEALSACKEWDEIIVDSIHAMLEGRLGLVGIPSPPETVESTSRRGTII